MEPQLTKPLRTAQHQIETPGDFTADETKWLLVDLRQALDAVPAPAVVLPIVHLNGTGRDDLIGARQACVDALEEARRKLREMAPNGRDYYPEAGRMDQALTQHARRQEALWAVQQEIEAEIVALDQA